MVANVFHAKFDFSTLTSPWWKKNCQAKYFLPWCVWCAWWYG